MKCSFLKSTAERIFENSTQKCQKHFVKSAILPIHKNVTHLWYNGIMDADLFFRSV